jgi:hypothetical protein
MFEYIKFFSMWTIKKLQFFFKIFNNVLRKEGKDSSWKVLIFGRHIHCERDDNINYFAKMDY